MATKPSFTELQKRIRDAEKQLDSDRQLAESMRGDELKAFVADWLAKAEAQSFTIVEVVEAIRPHFPTKGRKGPKRGSAKAQAGTKAAAKYRGPNGEEWSGRGQTPRWMKPLIEKGKKKEDFLIGKS